MQTERRVRLFRNGHSQAVRIPREFELQGTEALMRREGNRLIIEPVVKGGLTNLLASWESLDDDFPETEDFDIAPEDIF